MNRNSIDNINIISKFLAARDIKVLNKNNISKKYNIDKVDILVLLGNSILYTIELAAKAYNEGICDKIMIVGGIGHSTKILMDNIKKHLKFKEIETEGKSEGDVFFYILENYYGIDRQNIILENKSTNCGSNAIEALQVLKKMNKIPKSVILVQDPTMQLRTYEAFKFSWKHENVEFINFAPFIPVFNDNEEIINTEDIKIDGLWQKDRFISLIMGEIPRLRDDENGYGPMGRHFIDHVDIPKDVLDAYSELETEYKCYVEMRM